MLPNPTSIHKYLYIEKTPTWIVRSLYALGITTWLLVVYAYLDVIGLDPFYTYLVTPILGLLTVYHVISFGLNLFYKQFNLTKHLTLVRDYWKTPTESSVDIFLPICGEHKEVLENTWKHVSRLSHPHKTVYVLDDSPTHNQLHRELAEQFGFIYLSRPNKGEMKKAGNLKFGFEHSDGDYIAIFDADFAPSPDFFKETLPYMTNEHVAIVQTPQFFDTSKQAFKHSSLAYNAAYAEEPFYRFIQVTRDRFNGAVCCGSNALYRRSALVEIGGPYQIEHSEDAHTGFELIRKGYRLVYLPVILAIGLCPDNDYTFFHQQHRWCTGSMRLMLSKRFWLSSVSWKTKVCYITGFLFYLHHPLIILFSFHLFWTIFLYNDFIAQGNGLLYYPHLIFAVIYTWLFPITKLHIGYFAILTARTYAYSHAVVTAIFKKSVGWVSTNAKHSTTSLAFRQVTYATSGYILLYIALISLGIRSGDIHLFDHQYWSVQFWLFYNTLLSIIFLKQLLHTTWKMKQAHKHTS